MRIVVTIAALAVCASAVGEVTRVNLAPYANRRLLDGVAGDGKGGWTDGGPSDARTLPFGFTEFAGVPFRLVRPNERDGKCVVALAGGGDGGRGATALPAVESLKIPVKEAGKPRYLYLLHTASGGAGAGEVLGKVSVVSTAGKTVSFPVRYGTDIKDWWSWGWPKWEKNAMPGLAMYDLAIGGGTFGYVAEFPLPEKFGAVSEIMLTAEGPEDAGRVWLLLGATLSEEQTRWTRPREEETVTKAGPVWKRWTYPGTYGVVKGSVLDFASNIGDDPKGAELVRTDDGDYYRKDDPEKKPMRWLMKNGPSTSAFAALPRLGGKIFWSQPFVGHTLTRDPFEYMRQSTEAAADFGYNMMYVCDDGYWGGLHLPGARGSWDFCTEGWDLRDWAYKWMKERGMKRLVGQTRAGACWRKPWTDISRKEDGNFDPWGYEDHGHPRIPGTESRLRDGEGIARQFGAKGKYTGYNHLNDPDVLGVLMWNEASTSSIEKGQMDAFRTWLKEKYGTFAALKKAWGGKADAAWKDFADIPQEPFGDGNIGKRDVMHRDAAVWVLENTWENVDWFERECRKIGCTAPVVHDDMAREYYFALSREHYDTLYMHAYHAHPWGSPAPGARTLCNQDSALVRANSIFREFAAAAPASKPYFLTEAGVAFWNRYRYEFAFALSAYGALNGYDGILNFLGFGDGPSEKDPCIRTFFGSCDPVVYATEFLQAHIFRNRAVKLSPTTVRLRYSREEFEKNLDWDVAPSGLQTRLALVFRFGLEEASHAKPLGPRDVAIDRQGGVMMHTEKLFTIMGAETGNGGFDAVRFIDDMKRRGLLPKENRTDPANDIWESCTGELYLDCGRYLGAIDTPKVQGVTGLAGTTYDHLKDVKIRKMTRNGVLNVVGADGKPIRESKRLCVVYATNALNEGMRFTDRTMTTMIGEMKGPVIYECGAFEVEVRNENAAKLRCWAVDLTGARTEELPIVREDVVVRVKVDVAKLKKGPQVFFELAEK